MWTTIFLFEGEIMETKKPWLSRTILVNALGLVVQGVALMWPQANIVTQFITGHSGELLLGWNVLGIALRLITKGSIVLTE